MLLLTGLINPEYLPFRYLCHRMGATLTPMWPQDPVDRWHAREHSAFSGPEHPMAWIWGLLNVMWTSCLFSEGYEVLWETQISLSHAHSGSLQSYKHHINSEALVAKISANGSSSTSSLQLWTFFLKLLWTEEEMLPWKVDKTWNDGDRRGMGGRQEEHKAASP